MDLPQTPQPRQAAGAIGFQFCPRDSAGFSTEFQRHAWLIDGV